MKFNLRTIRAFSAYLLLIAALSTNAAFAQVNTDNSDIASAFGLGTGTDIRQAILHVVGFLLTFLGLAAVIIVLYGGYLWMTSAGNEEQVEKARSTLTAGLIGLVIILAAYAITQFTINTVVTQITG